MVLKILILIQVPLILCVIFIIILFQNVITGIKLPLYPYDVTVRNNNTVKFNEITANDIQNSHRRCLCACACYSFGDAFELWARVEVKGDEEENAPPVATPGTDRTHTRPNQKLLSQISLRN